MKRGDIVIVSGKTWVADGVITETRGEDAPWVMITTGEHKGESWSCLDLGSVRLKPGSCLRSRRARRSRK